MRSKVLYFPVGFRSIVPILHYSDHNVDSQMGALKRLFVKTNRSLLHSLRYGHYWLPQIVIPLLLLLCFVVDPE